MAAATCSSLVLIVALASIVKSGMPIPMFSYGRGQEDSG